jgi:triosephosphate isomerase
MDKLFIVANLKSYMNEVEGNNWLAEFLKHKDEIQESESKEIIIAPSFTLLLSFNSAFVDTNIALASQNLSPFDEGAYTGEVNAKQIKDYALFVIIGHSERRNYFNETDKTLSEKVNLALKYGLSPIYCVQGSETLIPEGVKIIAYEPAFAIGSGNPDTPENAESVCSEIMSKNSSYSILYGGSVTSGNVSSFTKNGKIKGVLVGGASLDPLEFIKIIKNA